METEIVLKKAHLCMKKGTKLKRIGYDTYRCTIKPNCQKVWNYDELIDKIKK